MDGSSSASRGRRARRSFSTARPAWINSCSSSTPGTLPEPAELMAWLSVYGLPRMTAFTTFGPLGAEPDCADGPPGLPEGPAQPIIIAATITAGISPCAERIGSPSGEILMMLLNLPIIQIGDGGDDGFRVRAARSVDDERFKRVRLKRSAIAKLLIDLPRGI